MNVLALFDGMSCGQIAFDKLNIKVDNYYASEIDKYSITVANENYPETIQLGDINNWQDWNIEQPDIIIGGSPCQGFSFAGKQLNFKDDRSKLFFVFVDILKHYKPKYFLLENVRMAQRSQNVISEILGGIYPEYAQKGLFYDTIEPIIINSKLVSAQNRERLYWSNIPNITQPKDKQIYLKDIIESGVVDREKSYCIDANYNAGANLNNYLNKSRRQLVFEKDKCIQVGTADLNGHDLIKRVYSIEGKAPCLTANSGGNQEPKISMNGLTWRKLTPLECERLQTVPDNYTNHVSKSQRYKMLGNGWTVDIITHILKNTNFNNTI